MLPLTLAMGVPSASREVGSGPPNFCMETRGASPSVTLERISLVQRSTHAFEDAAAGSEAGYAHFIYGADDSVTESSSVSP